MNLLSAFSAKVLGRKSRRQHRKSAVASRSGGSTLSRGWLRSLRLEPLEQRQLLSANISVPDGNFASDATGYYIDPPDYNGGNGASGGGGTFTQPMTGTLAGWSLSATASTANAGYGPGTYSPNGWDPFGVLDTVTSSGGSPYNSNIIVGTIGNQPGSTYNAFIYYPGEQYDSGRIVGGPQPGASLTMTTTGISATAVAGDIYTATIQYANVSGAGSAANPSANVAINILADGVLVGTGTLSGLAQDSAWTTVTAIWTADSVHAGQAIQIQVVATNFLEGPGANQQWEVPTFALADATLSATATVAPAAPSGLTATPVASSQINLSWTNNADSESLTGFQIDQATDPGFTQNLTTVTVGPNATTYSATGLSSDTTYYYQVRATNDAGTSANSSPASAFSAVTTAFVPVPDGNFSADAPGFLTPASGPGGPFPAPVTATLSGWTISADPSTANGGVYSGWEPYAGVDNVTSGAGDPPFWTYAEYIGNQPASNYDILLYDPGEQYDNGSVVGGAQPGASLTMTTTGISAAAVSGTTYTATIQYANVSQSGANVNPSANVALNILAGGVVVGTGSLSGLAQDSPWTTVTASWTADSAYAGQAIQLQVVATNFLEGPGAYQEWQVPTIGFTDATLTSATPVTVPAAPSGLTATPVSSSQVNLSWTNNANIPTDFQIEQATDPGFTQNLTTVTVGPNVTAYSATGLSSDTTYYYQVLAFTAAGDSANTPTASAFTAVTTAVIPVPDGNFASDTTGYYVDPPDYNGGNGANGGGGTFTQPMTGTLAGWSLSATASTANAGYGAGTYSPHGWDPFGVLDAVTSSGGSPYNSNIVVGTIGNQPAPTYNSFIYYPGEQYDNNSVVDGPQPGASLTMTTTGVSADAVSGTTYTATIQYANVSGGNNPSTNPSANVALNILAGGVVVGTGTLSGLAYDSPWTTVTATWTADSAYAGQAIQLQVVATNFLEGPGQWEVPTFGFADATLTSVTPVTIPAAPSRLTATTVSSSQVNLSWTDNSNGAASFQVEQATDPAFTQNLTTVTVGAGVTNYSATGLSSNSTYYYQVLAFNAAGDSANSSPASATTAVTTTVIPVPDGTFAPDPAGFYLTPATGSGGPFSSPLTGALSGWTISASPSTANGGLYYGWEPYAAVDTVTNGNGGSTYSYAGYIGNQPASSYQALLYYPGEQYNNGSVVTGAQPGASFTMTTSGITTAVVPGAIYTATIQYANVSSANSADNPSANVTLNILAGGVVVGTGTLSGLAQDSPWTTVTAYWTAGSAYAGQAIQLQVVATNFLEGPSQWQVPTIGFADATLTRTVAVMVNPTLTSMSVASGTDTIASPLPLTSGLTVLPAAGSQLTLSGEISGTGQSLTVNGLGTVVLSGANGYSGGTAVMAGTLTFANASAIPVGSSLTVGAGGVMIFNPSVSAAPVATEAATDLTAVASGPAAAASSLAAPLATSAATVAASPVVVPSSPLPSAPTVQPAEIAAVAIPAAAIDAVSAAGDWQGGEYLKPVAAATQVAEYPVGRLAGFLVADDSWTGPGDSDNRFNIVALDALLAEYGK